MYQKTFRPDALANTRPFTTKSPTIFLFWNNTLIFLHKFASFSHFNNAGRRSASAGYPLSPDEVICSWTSLGTLHYTLLVRLRSPYGSLQALDVDLPVTHWKAGITPNALAELQGIERDEWKTINMEGKNDRKEGWGKGNGGKGIVRKGGEGCWLIYITVCTHSTFYFRDWFSLHWQHIDI